MGSPATTRRGRGARRRAAGDGADPDARGGAGRTGQGDGIAGRLRSRASGRGAAPRLVGCSAGRGRYRAVGRVEGLGEPGVWYCVNHSPGRNRASGRSGRGYAGSGAVAVEDIGRIQYRWSARRSFGAARRARGRVRDGVRLGGGGGAATDAVGGTVASVRSLPSARGWGRVGGVSVVERVKGIEPSSLAWEAKALPLSYTRALSDD